MNSEEGYHVCILPQALGAVQNAPLMSRKVALDFIQEMLPSWQRLQRLAQLSERVLNGYACKTKDGDIMIGFAHAAHAYVLIEVGWPKRCYHIRFFSDHDDAFQKFCRQQRRTLRPMVLYTDVDDDWLWLASRCLEDCERRKPARVGAGVCKR